MNAVGARIGGRRRGIPGLWEYRALLCGAGVDVGNPCDGRLGIVAGEDAVYSEAGWTLGEDGVYRPGRRLRRSTAGALRQGRNVVTGPVHRTQPPMPAATHPLIARHLRGRWRLAPGDRLRCPSCGKDNRVGEP